MAYDVTCWVLAYVGIWSVQVVVGDTASLTPAQTAGIGLCCAAAHLLVGLPLQLHLGRSRIGSFDEALLISTAAAVVAAVAMGVGFAAGIAGRGLLLVTGPLLALTLMLWGRACFRVLRGRLEAVERNGTRALVIGAGEGAYELLNAMRTDSSNPWHPVGLVDDDRSKRHRRLHGLAVLGTTEQIGTIAEQTRAEVAIVAIPSADAATVRRISRSASAAGLEVKVLPAVRDLLRNDRVVIADVRDLELNDLLGRHTIDTDVASIAEYVAGKRVLVTGAGGSIGSELCRQLHGFGPAELIMLDRDESALHAVQLSISGRALLDDDGTVLGDIRDRDFVRELFAVREPQVVFHAAALKHLPMLEKAPGEAVKTNVVGTLHLLEAARDSGVERFVNISTDKAANPVSVLGYSKRLAEGLTTAVGAQAAGTFVSVRFGNVLGSRGSVLTAFAQQIARGGPLTVTDPRVTRFFMTIAEAVQLVIQAGAVGEDGQALVLDMGAPVSIDGVARQLVELSGDDIEVVYTGLREGEKLHEELFGTGEVDVRSTHPLISHVAVPEYVAERALAIDVSASREAITRVMAGACASLQVATGPLVVPKPRDEAEPEDITTTATTTTTVGTPVDLPLGAHP